MENLKYKIKLYIIPLLFFAVIILLSFFTQEPVLMARLIYSSFILGLFSLLAISYKEGRGSQRTRDKITISIIFILGVLAALIFMFYVPISIYGKMEDQNVRIFIGLVLVLNVIFFLLSVDWNKEEAKKRSLLFPILLTAALFIIFIVYLMIGLTLMHEETSLLSNFWINYRLFMGIVPILVLLLIPIFPRKTRYIFQPWILSLPAGLVGLFLILCLVRPNPYRPDQYIAYLEDQALFVDGQFQANLNLSYQERKELRDYSNNMARYPLPENLDLIKTIFERNWDISPEQQALFVETFGFHPISYLTPYEGFESHSFFDSLEVFLTVDQILPVFEESPAKMIMQNFSYPDLDESGFQEKDYQFDGVTYQLEAEIKTSPEEVYLLSLVNQDGESLISIDLLEMAERLGNTQEQAGDPADLVFPFEDGGRSGYLIIPYLASSLEDKNTLFRAILALEKEQTAESGQAIFSRINPEHKLTIDGSYQSIQHFSTNNHENGKWTSPMKIGDETYQIKFDGVYTGHNSAITITNQEGQTAFSLNLDRDELEDHLESDADGQYKSKHYENHDLAIDLLLYPNGNNLYDSIFFINKREK